VFLAVGRYHLFGVAPLPVVIVAVIAVVFWFLMERTRWGRVFYAVGGNETAAHLAGAPVRAYRVAAYVISGVLAALGGVLSPLGWDAATCSPALRCCSTASRHR
jgi:simple sugar transport system permease protein